MLLITSKKVFPVSRYSNFSISIFPSFFPCQPLLETIEINLKIYDVVKWLKKHTLFDILRRKEGLILKLGQLNILRKKYAKMCTKASPILVNSPKQSMHGSNSFENKIKKIIK